MKKWAAVFAVMAGFFVIYVGTKPYITAYQIKHAIERRDSEALSEHIEFSSLRQNIKDQINQEITKSMSEIEGINDTPFAGLGVALSEMFVNKMVDVYVTPAGLFQLLQTEQAGDGSRAGNKKQLAWDSSMFYV